MLVKIINEFSFQSFPKTDDIVDLDEKDLMQIGITKKFDVNSKSIIDYTYSKSDEEIKAELRLQREPLLEAFDKWEKAVLRGREQDSAEIMQWFENLKLLTPSAFLDENIPQRIKYYI